MAVKKLAVIEIGNEWVAGVFTSSGLYATCLPRKSRREAIRAVSGDGMVESDEPNLREVLEAVCAVSKGEDHPALKRINLDFSGLTEKQKRVMEETLRIPRGKTATYGEVAKRAGVPGGARFVGNVMATNRLGPIVPCHRVVASNGMGGYGPGIGKKIEILTLEGAFAD
ncbi:MAG: MGMT family protein [Candidatus Thorarchaeota archaeon]|nr:MAG: MGMT family protein [Candidatus Thorarchaeota archaeon]